MSLLRKSVGVMLLLSFGVIATQAQTTSVYQGTSASTRQLLRRIDTRIDLLRTSLNTRSMRNRTEATTVLNDFSNAVRQLPRVLTVRGVPRAMCS